MVACGIIVWFVSYYPLVNLHQIPNRTSIHRLKNIRTVVIRNSLPRSVVSAKISVEPSCTTTLVDLPVTEAMPEVPSRDPVLFVDMKHVTTDVIIRSCFRASIAYDHQNMQMFRRFRQLVPSIWFCYRGVCPRLLGQIVAV